MGHQTHSFDLISLMMWHQNTEGMSAGVNRSMASISRKSQYANWESWKGLLLGVWFSAVGLTKHQAVLRAHNETHPSWNVDSLRCQKADLIGLVLSPAVAITMAGFIFLNLRMARLSLQSSTWWVEEIAADISRFLRTLWMILDGICFFLHLHALLTSHQGIWWCLQKNM